MSRENLGLLFIVPGVIAVLVVIVKMSIIGYYDSDWSWMLPVGIIGFILTGIGYKLLNKKEK